MKRWLPIMAMLVFAALGLWGCDHDTSNGPVEPGEDIIVTDKTCLGCHSSEDELKLALGEESGSKVETAFKSDG